MSVANTGAHKHPLSRGHVTEAPTFFSALARRRETGRVSEPADVRRV